MSNMSIDLTQPTIEDISSKYCVDISKLQRSLSVLYKGNLINQEIIDENIKNINRYLTSLSVIEHHSFIQTTLEKAKSDYDRVLYVLPALKQAGLIDKIDDDLKKEIFEKAKSENDRAKYVLPAVIQAGLIDKIDDDLKKEIFEKAKSDNDWAKYVLPAVIQAGLIDKIDDDLKKEIFEKAKSENDRAKYVLPAVIQAGLIDKIDDLLKKEIFEKAKSDRFWVEYVLPAVIQAGLIDKIDDDLKQEIFEKAKSENIWLLVVLPAAVKVGLIDKIDDLLKKEIFEIAKNRISYARDVLPALKQAGLIDKIDDDLKQEIFEIAKSDYDRAKFVLPALKQTGLIDKIDDDLKQEIFEIAKSHSNWARYVLPAVIQAGLIDRIDDDLKKEIFEKAKSENIWLVVVLPAAIKVGLIDKIDDDLKKEIFEKAKNRISYARDVLPALKQAGLIDQIDDDLKKEIFEKAKSDYDWVKFVLPAVIQAGLIDRIDDDLKQEIFEIAKSDSNWARYVLPAVIQAGLIEKPTGEIHRHISKGLEKNVKKFLHNHLGWSKIFTNYCLPQQRELITQLGPYIAGRDSKFLESFSGDKDMDEILGLIEKKDFETLWYQYIKRTYYNDGDRSSVATLQLSIGTSITFDYLRQGKINDTDLHNALLQRNKLAELATYFSGQQDRLNTLKRSDENSREKMIMVNLLKDVAKRQNGYIDFNAFLGSQRDKDWLQKAKENVSIINDPAFTQMVLELEQAHLDGSLYQDLPSIMRIGNVTSYLKNIEALKTLQGLAQSQDQVDHTRYEYFKQGIYHPRTNADLFIRMYTNPDEFLGMSDTTLMAEQLHESKKPQHMVSKSDYPYIGLSAEELVNCMPLGVYDSISYFKPQTMVFWCDMDQKKIISTGASETQDIKDIWINSLDGLVIESVEKHHKLLGQLITKYNEGRGDSGDSKEVSYRDIKDRFGERYQSLDGVEKRKLIHVLSQAQQLGDTRKQFVCPKSIKKFTAMISPKSDPTNRFNGWNCDSFVEGNGKKIVSMFNPLCADFCIYEGEKSDLVDHLLVNSWVTLNQETGKNTGQLIKDIVKGNHNDVSKLLGKEFEQYISPQHVTLTMDNAEAKLASHQHAYAGLIGKMYESFFTEYVKNNPITPGGIPVDTKKFYCGKSYGKVQILEQTAPNTTLPLFVNSYTDNSENDCYVGKLSAGETPEKEKKTGVHPLTIEDTIPLTYLEQKIYPEGLKAHASKIQHELCAITLRNQLKRIPDIALGYYNQEGKLAGYMLAYVGFVNERQCVYVSDFAVTGANSLGGAKIASSLLDKWMKTLDEKGLGELPIVAHARESTSYKLITNKSESKGYQICHESKTTLGNEDFHHIVMSKKGVKIDNPEEFVAET